MKASEPKHFTVPQPTSKDGWYEVPKWLMEAGAVPYPRNKWTLPDGSVAQPGQTITLGENGLTATNAEASK